MRDATAEKGYVDGYPPSYVESDSGTISLDFRRLAVEIKIHKWLIITVTSIFFCLALLYAHHKKPIYKSSVLIKVEATNNAAMSVAGSLGSILGRFPFMGGGQANASLVEQTLMGSSFILGAVVEKLHLDVHAMPRKFPLIGGWIASSFKGSGIAAPFLGLRHFGWGGQKIEVDYLKVNTQYINKNLRLVANKRGHYTLYGPNGQKLLNGEVGKLAQSGRHNPAITVRVNELQASPGNYFSIRKTDLDRAIQQLKLRYKVTDIGSGDTRAHTGILKLVYLSRNPDSTILFLNTLADVAYESGAKLQAERAAQTLMFLNRQLPEIQSSLKASEAALSAYQAKSGNIDMGEQYRFLLRELSTSQATIEGLKLQRAELLQKYTSEHPYVVTLNSKIHEAQKAVTLLERKLHKLPITDKKAVQLLREVKTKNKLYLMLLARQQELRVLKAGVKSNIRILNYASTPPLMIPPSRVAFVLSGIFLGLMLSLLYILIKIFTNRTISDTSILEEKFGLDVKTVIPYSDKQVKLLEDMQQGGFPVGKSYLASEVFPNTALVESLRSLRTNLQLNLMECSGKVISIFSLTPGVGKSFLSANISYLFSALNLRTLLIDTDLRKGYIHKYFHKSMEPGLTDLLMGTAGIDEVIKPYQNSTLSFMPRGKQINNTSDILSAKEFDEVVSWAKAKYDIIIFDTAPILLLTDAIVAAKNSDVNVMLLASEKHTASDLKAGLDIFSRNKLNLSGAILNFANYKSQNKYGSYAYHNYGYNNKYEGYYAEDKQ
ncbi:MAG: polysaccharide biosynthesis tyrosine autokinase [Coxiellaceae bacterium]|nr:polysaccharide biosynthesis tyrosine autokinase [Coxiellaceae bacterium]